MGKKEKEQPAATTAGQPEKEQAAAKPSIRRVYLFGRLENEVTLPIIKKILKLNDDDPNTPIDLFINSSGGNGYNADAVISVMQSIQAKVNTICLGHALSGACEILASGTGERSSYEFATLMFHQTLWEADGDITNLEIQAAQGQRFRNAQIEMLARCTGQDKQTIRKDIERDHYMSAEEARSYGIIDKVIYHTGRPGATAGGASLGGKREPAKAKAAAAASGKTAKSAAAMDQRRQVKGKSGKAAGERRRTEGKSSSRRSKNG